MNFSFIRDEGHGIVREAAFDRNLYRMSGEDISVEPSRGMMNAGC